MENTQESPLNVVIVPTPGMGHLIPLIEFANRLVNLHKFSVTFIIPNDGSTMELPKKLLLAQPEPISTIFLPPVSFDDLPEDARNETRIIQSLTRSLHFLRDEFKSLVQSTRVVAFVVDVFGIDAFDIAKEFGLEPYVFLATGFMLLSLIFELPKLDQIYSCEYRDLPEPIKLPGCVPFDGRDIPDPLQHRKDFVYQHTLQQCKDFPLAAGIIVNSFIDFEKGPFEALTEVGRGLPPVYPVGPLTRNSSDNEVEGFIDCLKWLDEQPIGSVLYVCFGSGGTLSREQMNELALGLEMSGQRFLWVVKEPVETAANATYFGSKSFNDPFSYLPDGFLERTKEVGLVIPSWAPQVHVLSHGSTGGFLTHCGWNSILEAIVHGVPLIAWPLYAEQKMNATLLKDDSNVAFRVNVNENGLVGREDIAKYAKQLIEGDEGKLLRTRMRELKNAAKMALSPHGSSTNHLAKVAGIWKKKGIN
ncbi:UDP-glucuronosyl/UDP-glucosyltransferase [Corchorus olitorius]|uniref:Glycosyltransferase n=1 Tax=Corchorus olitorius TaxID=93759 RepID=A0A1R3K7D4_9ROSI|nr:UDP-glucuronosyl/UDP-glucosyltransferase [Corchorus olitorius]